MRGICAPLSGSEAKKGRVTTIVFLVIWLGGTASSKSNDRTKENKMAFILIFSPINIDEYTANTWVTMTDSLDYRKAVADARVCTRDERQ